MRSQFLSVSVQAHHVLENQLLTHAALEKMEVNFGSVFCFAGIAVGLLIAFKLFGSKTKKSKPPPPGVVALHLFPRSLKMANGSPPCLKLETYLRITKIPYECDFNFNRSSKGKMPWIEYNGQEIADSNFCVEFLNKKFGVDLDAHLSLEQKGMARAIRVMLEENTYWSIVYHRWCSHYAPEFRDVLLAHMSAPVRYLTFRMMQSRMKAQLHGHGMGRHSEEDIYGIAEKDLRAASACLRDKQFLFGDKPCLADVSLFALVGNFIWDMPQCPQGKLILTELKNLAEHSKRVKEAFYPDWDEITSRKKKAD